MEVEPLLEINGTKIDRITKLTIADIAQIMMVI